jgi:hypothetical protein
MKISTPLLASSVLALCGLLALIGCGEDVGHDGTLVGGPCSGAADCEFRCLTGGDYPQGTCSLPCNTDRDCPSGTHCIDKDGGMCLLACTVPSDCRFDYNCKGEKNRGHGGDSLVCRK